MPAISEPIASVPEVIDSYLRSSAFTPGSVLLRGANFNTKELTDEQLSLLVAELETLSMRYKNPNMAAMIARGAERILDLVRMVNYRTNAGFYGARARGDQLVVDAMRISDLSLTTWVVNRATAAAVAWAGSSTTNISMLVSSLPVLGHVFLGFADPVGFPLVDKIQLIKDGDPWVPEVVQFQWRDTMGDNQVPMYELREPWILPPQATYYIALNYFSTGEDRLLPIAFVVRRARDTIAALA